MGPFLFGITIANVRNKIIVKWKKNGDKNLKKNYETKFILKKQKNKLKPWFQTSYNFHLKRKMRMTLAAPLFYSRVDFMVFITLTSIVKARISKK